MLGERRGLAAVVNVDPGGGETAGVDPLDGGGNVNAGMPFTAAGPDGRLIAAWIEDVGCGPNNDGANVPELPAAAFAAPNAGFAPIAQPPNFVTALAFRSDGSAYAIVGSTSVSGVAYDTGVPIGTTPPPPGGGGKPPGGPGRPHRPVGKLTATPRPDGSLQVRVQVLEPGDLAFYLYARRAGLLAGAAKAKPRKPKNVQVLHAVRHVKHAGTVKVRLRLTGAAARTLRARHKLTLTLRATFRPAAKHAKTITVSSRTVVLRIKPKSRKHAHH